jgi:elongation factor Ts
MGVEISAQAVKELRDKTSAGMMDCKKALQDANGDMAKAMETLRQKGLASADKKASRIATEGVIESYIHMGGKLGVMVEVNCETDFVARRPEFQELAKNIAMQIAASPSVEYITLQSVPSDIVQKEKEIESSKEDLAKKPADIKEKIVEGRIQKRLKELTPL